MAKMSESKLFSDIYRNSLVLVIMFIILIHVITLSVSNEHFSFENLAQVHISNPLTWILYAVAGGFLWFANRYNKCKQRNYRLFKQKEQMEKNQEKALNFAKELESGNFDINYQFNNDDQIGEVLINLRDKLKHNQEEELKRQKEDEQRNWISDGLAKFNDILRQDKGNDIYELSYNIISNLVKYLGANQGGLFIINEDEEQKQDQEDGYLTRYLRSGERHILGEAREEEGVTKDGQTFPIELRVEEAWLDSKRMFIGLVKDITEKKKAEEELKQQMEEVRSQDEELRQNIEELQATQEQLKEKDEQQRKEIEKLNAENEKKLERMKQMKEDQKKKDEETKRLYEGEIDLMFDTWLKHLKTAEEKLNHNNDK